MFDHEGKAILEEQAEILLRKISEGIELSDAIAETKVTLEAMAEQTKIRTRQVLSDAVCRAFDRDLPELDVLLQALESKRDSAVFKLYFSKERKSGNFEKLWRLFETLKCIFSEEILSKEKALTAEWILKKSENAQALLEKLSQEFPHDEILSAYERISRAMSAKGRGKPHEAKAIVNEIELRGESSRQPVAFALIRRKFGSKACQLVHSSTSVQRSTIAAMAREMMKAKQKDEAVKLIRPYALAVPTVEGENKEIGFQLDILSAYAECARRDPQYAEEFLSVVQTLEETGALPEPVCEGLRHLFLTGKKNQGKIAADPRKENFPKATRSRFFQYPHDILRSTPLNRTATRVIAEDLQKKPKPTEEEE